MVPEIRTVASVNLLGIVFARATPHRNFVSNQIPCIRIVYILQQNCNLNCRRNGKMIVVDAYKKTSHRRRAPNGSNEMHSRLFRV